MENSDIECDIIFLSHTSNIGLAILICPDKCTVCIRMFVIIWQYYLWHFVSLLQIHHASDDGDICPDNDVVDSTGLTIHDITGSSQSWFERTGKEKREGFRQVFGSSVEFNTE